MCLLESFSPTVMNKFFTTGHREPHVGAGEQWSIFCVSWILPTGTFSFRQTVIFLSLLRLGTGRGSRSRLSRWQTPKETRRRDTQNILPSQEAKKDDKLPGNHWWVK